MNQKKLRKNWRRFVSLIPGGIRPVSPVKLAFDCIAGPKASKANAPCGLIRMYRMI
ncbi:hypothetical protein ABEB33_07545 [Herbaspirillum huttiense]|uniref:hypothetical protein n=1 Tax=Herbaspirillum huttiense TaxID=863372 RepID=UPI001416FCE8|nr:hypothetical protein [Herbaspirillum huttiense]